MFSFPDTSRVWIYKADRFLTDDEAQGIQQKVDEFIPTWAAHGKKLYAEAKVIDNLWIVIAADESREGASGCSIDKIFRLVADLEKEYACSFTNRLILAYQSEGQIKLAPLTQIKELGINADTLIYDDTVQNLGDFKNRLKPAIQTWLKRSL